MQHNEQNDHRLRLRINKEEDMKKNPSLYFFKNNEQFKYSFGRRSQHMAISLYPHTYQFIKETARSFCIKPAQYVRMVLEMHEENNFKFTPASYEEIEPFDPKEFEPLFPNNSTSTEKPPEASQNPTN